MHPLLDVEKRSGECGPVREALSFAPGVEEQSALLLSALVCACSDSCRGAQVIEALEDCRKNHYLHFKCVPLAHVCISGPVICPSLR